MFSKMPLASAILMIAATVAAYALVTTGFKMRHSPSDSVQETVPIAVRSSPDKIRAGALWPQLRWYLTALGDRLQQSGKERLTLTGTVDSVDQQRIAFTAILEFPDRLQLTTSSLLQTRTVSYDGQAVRVSDGTLTTVDQNRIESLVNDSAEHFFKNQAQGAPTRHLGNRFRSDDGSTENYTGTYHDIFSVLDNIAIGPTTRSRTKFYYFNSDTRLLEKVGYDLSRDGETVQVRTEFSDWRLVDGQRVAHRITRFDNGKPVMTMVVTSATLSAKLTDGLF